MTPGKARGRKSIYGLRAPKAAIQKIVSPPSGLWGTYLSFTPGCTGGHNCQDPSDLGIIKVLQQINLRSFSLKISVKNTHKKRPHSEPFPFIE